MKYFKSYKFITIVIAVIGAGVLILLQSDKPEYTRRNLLDSFILLEELRPLVNEVTNTNFRSDENIKAKYNAQLNRIDELSEEILDNLIFLKSIRKYNDMAYNVIRYSVKMDLLSLISITNDKLKNNRTDNTIFFQEFVEYVDLYYKPLMSLYENNVDVYSYLMNYKEPFCSHEDCMEELKRQMQFLSDEIKTVDKTLELSMLDNQIKNGIVEYSGKSYSLYGISSGLYENVEQFSQWEFNQGLYILDYESGVMLKNIYKYKASKSLKNIYLSKIYMQFIMLDDKYINDFNKQQMEQEYPEEFYEESTLFVSGCTNPQYLLENTLNKCVDFIKNASTAEDAFSYLEDENIKYYVMIDDKLCAKQENGKYIFYDNENIMCETLKEKVENNG